MKHSILPALVAVAVVTATAAAAMASNELDVFLAAQTSLPAAADAARAAVGGAVVEVEFDADDFFQPVYHVEVERDGRRWDVRVDTDDGRVLSAIEAGERPLRGGAERSLEEAVAIAERAVGGDAMHAEFESGRLGATCEVTVVRDLTTFEVVVSLKDGAVLSMVEDRD